MISSNDTSIYEFDANNKSFSVKDSLVEILSRYELVWLLAKRDLFARYRRSVLGVFWSLLEPLGIMVVMSAIFGVLINQGIPNFSIYLFCGLITWQFFSDATSKSMLEIRANGPLMSKVYLPGGVFIFSSVLSSLVSFMISFLILLLMALILGQRLSLHLFIVPFSLLIVILFTVGMSFILGSVSVLFADMRNIYAILLRALMYGSGIFYEIKTFPEILQFIIKLNPVYQIIQLIRYPFYYNAIPPFWSSIYILVISLVIFFIGIIILSKTSKGFAFRV